MGRERRALGWMAVGALLLGSCASGWSESKPDASYAREFQLGSRTLGPTGRSRYCILEPGFRIVLASDDARVAITVLDETRVVLGTTTRVVEEREWEDGELAEVSRNFLAIDADSGDVFYFGEEVDTYEDDQVDGHEGAWLAGRGGALPGLLMPGRPAVGAKYYLEYAPGKALDRAEVVSVTHTLATPTGEFRGCLRTLETSGLKPKEREFKTFAPDIGQVQDEDLLLVESGFAAGGR